MQRRLSAGTRIVAGLVPAPIGFLCAARIGLAVAATACLLVAGCSPGADYPASPPYPSIFPTARDLPPPPADAPMNQLELQKATEDLISQRNRLNAEAPPSAPEKSAISSGPEGKTASSPAKKTPPKTVRRSVPPQQAAAAPPATTASTQGAGEAAGADPKP